MACNRDIFTFLPLLAGMVSCYPHVIQMNAAKYRMEFSFLLIISELIVTEQTERPNFGGTCPAHSLQHCKKKKDKLFLFSAKSNE
jgi:hypothetical protein